MALSAIFRVATPVPGPESCRRIGQHSLEHSKQAEGRGNFYESKHRSPKHKPPTTFTKEIGYEKEIH